MIAITLEKDAFVKLMKSSKYSEFFTTKGLSALFDYLNDEYEHVHFEFDEKGIADKYEELTANELIERYGHMVKEGGYNDLFECLMDETEIIQVPNTFRYIIEKF